MDDVRLENGDTINGKADFDTLLKRVREIRFSEKQIYEKIKDLFATASDYSSNDAEKQKIKKVLDEEVEKLIKEIKDLEKKISK